MDEIARQIDNYEREYGPCDRTEFDGEFVIPAEIRNRVNSKGSLRISGGLLTLSRSRTLFTLTSNSKSSIHNSTPDLSRSISRTPTSSHKLSLTSSYDSVLEENEEDGVIVIKKGVPNKEKSAKNIKHVQHIFDNPPPRRKSEDFLDSRPRNGNTMKAVEMQQKHVRQSSDQAYRLIPRVKNPPIENSRKSSVQSVELKESSTFSVNTSAKHSTASLDSETIYTRWGYHRGSNSFAADLNVSSLSSYSIPRVSLSNQRAIDPNTTIASRKSSSTNNFYNKHEYKDS